MPDYIRERVACRIIEGPIDKRNMLGPNTPPIAGLVPDYRLLDSVPWKYKPEDAYFCRTTKGCIRKCKFCAVPKLEPRFEYLRGVRTQIREVNNRFGERQHLVLLDNNILAIDRIDRIINEIRDGGFEAGEKRNGRLRTVDFNQGIDARLINAKVAKALSTVSLDPVRLAFDFDSMESPYRQAIHRLAKVGFKEFTNYVMFNYNDTPRSLYHRLKVNIELNQELGIRITGFPMRYIPIDDVNRKYVSKGWHWRYLRGIQCVLLATRGLVSPNPEFFAAAFGDSYGEFLEILSMPDHYIIHRNRHKGTEARDWKKLYGKLSQSEREQFLSVLASLNKSKTRKADIASQKRFRDLLEHYYPGGEIPPGEKYKK